MKTLTLNFLFFVIFISFFTVEITNAQESTNLAMNFETSQESTNLGMNYETDKESTNLAMNYETDKESTKAVYSFAPNNKLSNEKIWDRVSEYRFECAFLKLAIEYHNNVYFLSEMEGEKRLLARDIQFTTIVEEIANLTLNN